MKDSAIINIFTYHPPTGSQIVRYEEIRAAGKIFAQVIQKDCPESREKSLAITNLQQAVMWANASIAINESFDDLHPPPLDYGKKE